MSARAPLDPRAGAAPTATLAAVVVAAVLALPGCLSDALREDAFVAKTSAELDGAAADGGGFGDGVGGADAKADAEGAKDAGSDTGAVDAKADADAACKPAVGACDDANACTTDSCVNGACTHVAVLDTTPCSKAGGGTGVCKAGVCK